MEDVSEEKQRKIGNKSEVKEVYPMIQKATKDDSRILAEMAIQMWESPTCFS